MDRRRQVEKDKMTVQECTYTSTVTGNVVTRRDNDDSSGKKRRCGTVVTWSMKCNLAFVVCYAWRWS